MNATAAVARIDAYQRGHRWASLPLATAYKFVEDQGSYLAAMMTYYGFVSLFPLMLLLVTVLGFVLEGRPELQVDLVESALTRFPVIGHQIAENVGSLRGSGVGLAVGVVGIIYGGLGVATATQNALNRVWSVPRHERPNPLRTRLRSMVLLGVMSLGVLAATILSALTTSARTYGADVGAGVRVLAIALAILVNVVLLLVAFRVGTAHDVPTADLRLGAVVTGVLWQVLQLLGTYFLGDRLKDATQVYGMFGMVLGLLVWIYLQAFVLVLGAELNVVVHRRLYPRALLAPLVEDVDLTSADKRTYAAHAQGEKFKESERVQVTFHPDESDAPRGRAPEAPR
jgi:YihY family inner membrane protein